MSKEISRREFTAYVTTFVGGLALSGWMCDLLLGEPDEKNKDFHLIKKLLETLQKKNKALIELGFEGWQEDLLESADIQDALGFAYVLLDSLGIDGDKYFVEMSFYQNEPRA